MQLDTRSSDASMKDEYLEKSRTLDSGRGGMAGHALGIIERWRAEQNWMSLKRRKEEVKCVFFNLYFVNKMVRF